MAVYTHISNDEIEALLEQYDLGHLRFAVGIAQGVENSNYLIECQKKDAITKYILTIYEKRVNPQDLPFFLGLMQHLSARGFACPLPIQTRKSELLTQVNGKPAAIISFLEGHSKTQFKNAHLAELGASMAKMHLAANGFKLVRENTLSLAGWKQLSESLGDKLDTVLSGLSGAIAKEIAWLEQHWPTGLPRGVIHADLFPDNVFFTGNHLSGVIDYYFACEDFFAYELAICMNCWCFEPSHEFNVTKAGHLFKAYDKVRLLTDRERHALPILARGAALRFLLTRAHDKIHHDASALVVPKDPLEYWKKLLFHQQVQSVAEYGIV